MYAAKGDLYFYTVNKKVMMIFIHWPYRFLASIKDRVLYFVVQMDIVCIKFKRED